MKYKAETPIRASTADDLLDTLVDSHNRLTPEQRKRRKQFLLLLLAFFGWQGHELATGVRADDSKFTVRLGAAIRDGMMATPQTFEGPISTQRFAEEVGKQAMAVAERINATTAKSIDTAVSSGQAIADAVDDVYRRSVESRAAVIEGDMTFVADQIAEAVAAEVAMEELVWRTREDEKVCAICGPLDGVVAKVGQEFAPGIRYPVLSTHANCRCYLQRVPKAGEPNV